MSPHLERYLRRSAAFIIFMGLLATAGCGSSATGTVTGKVTYKNMLLKGGSVTLSSTEGKGATSGRIEPDGTYTVRDAPTGNVKISVQTKFLKPKTGRKFENKPPGGKENPNSPAAPADTSKMYVRIPDKYESGETSDLIYTVVAGNQEKDIPLE